MYTNLRHLGIGFIYLGCILIAMAVKSPFDLKLPALIGLIILGVLNIGFYGKLTSKFWWYQPLILGVTVALVLSPFVLLSVIKTIEGR